MDSSLPLGLEPGHSGCKSDGVDERKRIESLLVSIMSRGIKSTLYFRRISIRVMIMVRTVDEVVYVLLLGFDQSFQEQLARGVRSQARKHHVEKFSVLIPIQGIQDSVGYFVVLFSVQNSFGQQTTGKSILSVQTFHKFGFVLSKEVKDRLNWQEGKKTRIL